MALQVIIKKKSPNGSWTHRVCFRKFIFSQVSEEFMDCINVVLQVNDVFEGNGPKNPTAIHGTLHLNHDTVKGHTMG
jgi:hypothetical protein